MTDLASPIVAPRAGRRAHPLARFVVRRMITGLITLLAVSVLVFVGTSIVPGNPASTLLGKDATPAAIHQLDAKLGLNRPAPERYIDWLGDLAHGDLGKSSIAVAQGSPDPSVWGQTSQRLVNTVALALITMLLLVPISLLLGVAAAIRAGRVVDQIISTTTLVMVAVPEFVIGTMLLVLLFAQAHWLPPVSAIPPGASPLSNLNLLVMPVLTLLLSSLAWTTRFVRVGTLDVLEAGFVQTARLHGIPERTVLSRYALRNALAPTVQIFAFSFQYLFGGVIVTEVVFGYPGIGSELVNAVLDHDITTVQSLAMLLGALYIAINILADVAVVLLVPKLRTSL